MAAVLKQLPDSSVAPEPASERYVWRSTFGDIIIEVKGEDVYVDGKKVEAVARDSSGPV